MLQKGKKSAKGESDEDSDDDDDDDSVQPGGNKSKMSAFLMLDMDSGVSLIIISVHQENILKLKKIIFHLEHVIFLCTGYILVKTKLQNVNITESNIAGHIVVIICFKICFYTFFRSLQLLYVECTLLVLLFCRVILGCISRFNITSVVIILVIAT